MLLYIYILMTVIMGIAAISKGAVYPGIAGIVGPTVCWFAASGLKGSLIAGDLSQKLFGIAAATVTLALGLGIVYHSGYRVGLFGHWYTGVTWCIVGFAVGWISTNRQVATA